MARAQYIWLVWEAGQLAGAFTVKHEMESAVKRWGLQPDQYAVQRVRDGGSYGGPLFTLPDPLNRRKDAD